VGVGVRSRASICHLHIWGTAWESTVCRVEYKVGERQKKSHNYSAENWKEKKPSGSHETDLGWVESQFKL